MDDEHYYCADEFHRCWDGGGEGEARRYNPALEAQVRRPIKIKVEHEQDGTRIVCDQCGLTEDYDPWRQLAPSERWFQISRESMTAHAGPSLDFCSWACLRQWVIVKAEKDPFEGVTSDDRGADQEVRAH